MMVVAAAAAQVAFGGLREEFRSPQGAARVNTGPLFWMHGTESEQRLRDYVRVVAESGQGSLTIESRPHEGWMLDSWWRDVDIILDECRKRGIKMLVYDDYWLPSQGMGCMFPIPKEFQCRDIKFAFYARGKEPARVENEIARVTANEVSKNVFDLRPDGDKVIIYSWAVADPGNVYALPRGRKIPLVNGLDEAAVDWFLEKFYQPYYDRYKDAFKDGTIPGFFFDEPYTKGWWGPALEREFAARGDNVGELITALFFRIADPERHARARYRFLDAHVEVWGRTMYGRHSDWCARHGVYSSGHFFEHGSTHYDLTFSGGNVMQLLKYVAVPGIDVVCRQVYSDMREKRNVEIDCGQMPKYASSMAHVYNRNGGLNWCETFGAYGQNLSYPQMKWICDWLQYQGCSFLIPHSFNMKAPLDSDCPPYFYNGGYEPRFPLYRVWADYNNRCALMLSGTGHVCRIAQCMPGISYHVGKTIRPEMFAFAIQDAQLDSDFMDYGAVETCRIGKNPRTGRPALQSENGTEWYDIFVLPATEYVPFPVLEKARAFAKAGGVVVGYGVRPCNTPTHGKTAEDVRKVVAEIFTQPTALFIEGEPDGVQLRAALAKEYPPSPKATEDGSGEKRPLAIREFDFEGLDPKDGRKLAVKLNEKGGNTILFIANQDDKLRRDLKVRAQWSAEKAELWNPMQGTIERPEVEDGLVKVSLEPSETVFVVWPEEKGFGRGEHVERVDSFPVAWYGVSDAPLRIDVSAKETVTPVVVENGPEYAALMDFVKPLEGAKWIWHPKNSMASGHVKFRATIDLAKAEEAQVVFACDTTATIYVNGEKVAHQPPGAEGYYYGWSVPVRTNLTFKAGRNEITVEAENRYPSESKKPRLAGFVAAFTWPGGAFRTDDKSWLISRAGEGFVTPKVVRNFGDRPWQKCMLGPTRSPYKASVATECRFSMPRVGEGDRVHFVCGGTEGENSAAIEVNGAFAGGFIGKPYRLDITRIVKDGENVVVARPFRLKNPRVEVIGRSRTIVSESPLRREGEK